MADWKKLAKSLALSDGCLDLKKTEILRRELLVDGKLDKFELEFLLELRRSATTVSEAFDQLLFSAIKPIILRDGLIDKSETAWLRSFILWDGRFDEGEKQFLRELKAAAKTTCPEFEELLKSAE